MVTYIIASKARNQFLAECEALGDYLQKNCNDVSVKTVIKHKQEWPEFLDSVCRTYGFKKRSCPLIYTIEGTLIGDAQQFIEHVKEKYSKAIAITKEAQKRRTMQNINMINEYMRKKKDGLTLGEKINSHLDSIKQAELVDLLEAFYTEEMDRGCLFHVRRGDFMFERRYKNVVDEVEERIKAQKIEDEKEAKRDMTYDEFLLKYIDHIEGKVDADARLGNRPLTADDNDNIPPAQASTKNQSALTHQNQFEENKGEEDQAKASDKLNESNMSRGKSRGDDMNKSKDSILSKDDYKYEIPQDCIMSILKGNQIEKLTKKYVLLSHPFPKVEGEMVLFQPLKQDQYDPQVIVYRDYSLRKRLATRPRPKKLSSYQQKKLDTEDKEQSKLRCLEIDLRQPLSTIDWQNFATVLQEVQGLGFVSILPVGEKSAQPFQYQLIHILPNSKIPFQSLPLDLLITAKVQYVKMQQEQALEEARQLAMNQSKAPSKGGKDGKEAVKKPEVSSIITLDEYNFPHAVFIYDNNQLKEEILHNGYNKIHQFLNLDDHPEVGLTIIVSPSWMFVATLTGPYTKHNDIPVYADPYAYLGIVNIQNTIKAWPATAGLQDDTLNPFEILERSSQYGRPEHDQILGYSNIDLERKKASQILHYLMERKQETSYQDPFELLKNMQDVITLYDKPKNGSKTQKDEQNDKLKQISDDQSTTNSSRQSYKPNRFTHQTFQQSSQKVDTKHNQNLYSNFSGTKSKKNILNRSSILNQSQDNNQIVTTKTSTNNTTVLSKDLENKINEYSSNDENLQFPMIMRKQRTFYNQKTLNSTGMRSTKTFSQKKEDRVLDLSNIPEITQNVEPDTLQLRYEKIKKLKEEFKDIKTQFKIPEPQYFNPNNIQNTNSTLYSKRLDIQSRGSIIVNQSTKSKQEPISVQKKDPLNLTEMRKQKLTEVQEFKEGTYKQRPSTSNTQVPVKTIRELKQAKINKNAGNQTYHELTSPSSKVELNSRKFVNNQTVQRNVRNQSENNIQNKIVRTLATTKRRRQIPEPEVLDESKLMEKMGNSAIMQLSDSATKNTNNMTNIFLQRRYSNQNDNTNNNSIMQQNKQLIQSKIDFDNSLSNSVDITLNNFKAIQEDATPISGGIQGIKQLQLLKENLNFQENLLKKDFSFDNILNSKTIDFPKFQDLQSQNNLAIRPPLPKLPELIFKPYEQNSQRNNNDQQQFLAISSRSFNQPSQELEIEKQKFSTIGDVSVDQLIAPPILQSKQQTQQDDKQLQQKHSSLLRTRNLESIQEEDTAKQQLNISPQKIQKDLNSIMRRNSQKSERFITKDKTTFSNNQIKEVDIEDSECKYGSAEKGIKEDHNQKQQHTGVSLYEQYMLNQQKQIQLLQKKKKKELKKQKKQQKITVESVYMREAILALIHSQSNNLNPLKMRHNAKDQQKSRKMSNACQQQLQEYYQYSSVSNKRSKSQLQKKSKKHNDNDINGTFINDNTQNQLQNISQDLSQEVQFLKQQNDNIGEDKSDCLVQSLTQHQSTQIIHNYKLQQQEKLANNSSDSIQDNYINDL